MQTDEAAKQIKGLDELTSFVLDFLLNNSPFYDVS